MMEENISYTEAFRELQEITAGIEEGTTGIDELSEKVKRATMLIRICREKLTATEEDVNQILRELEEKGD